MGAQIRRADVALSRNQSPLPTLMRLADGFGSKEDDPTQLRDSPQITGSPTSSKKEFSVPN